jgi:hypothetical protein
MTKNDKFLQDFVWLIHSHYRDGAYEYPQIFDGEYFRYGIQAQPGSMVVSAASGGFLESADNGQGCIWKLTKKGKQYMQFYIL